MLHASTASWQEHASVQRDVYYLSVAGCQLRLLWSGLYSLWYRLEILLKTPAGRDCLEIAPSHGTAQDCFFTLRSLGHHEASS